MFKVSMAILLSMANFFHSVRRHNITDTHQDCFHCH